MHLGLVCPFDPWPMDEDAADAHVGGVERSIGELAHALARRGHTISLIHTAAEDEAPGHVPHENVRRVPLPRIGTLMRAPITIDVDALPRDLDLVQSPATYPILTPSVLRWARRRDVPTVLDFHFEPKVDGLLGTLATRVYMPLAGRGYRWVDACVVRSARYAQDKRSLQDVSPERRHEIPNGIDPLRFHADGPGAEGDYVLCVGRLVPYKGVDVLLDALGRMGEPPALRIAGDGPLRARLEEKVRTRGLDVTFLGKVPDDALPKLYRGARFTVLPSINSQEAFGMTLIESMACGTPVVASDLPGVGTVARLGGLVARPGDADDLARQMDAMLHAEARPTRSALSKRTHDMFSWDAIAATFERVYERVLSDHGTPITTTGGRGPRSTTSEGPPGRGVFSTVARTRGSHGG